VLRLCGAQVRAMRRTAWSRVGESEVRGWHPLETRGWSAPERKHSERATGHFQFF